MHDIGILMGITLNLYINFSNVVMFITLILMIYEHRNLLMLIVSSSIYLITSILQSNCYGFCLLRYVLSFCLFALFC